MPAPGPFPGRLPSSEERIEDPRQKFGRDGGAVVRQLEADARPLGAARTVRRGEGVFSIASRALFRRLSRTCSICVASAKMGGRSGASSVTIGIPRVVKEYRTIASVSSMSLGVSTEARMGAWGVRTAGRESTICRARPAAWWIVPTVSRVFPSVCSLRISE